MDIIKADLVVIGDGVAGLSLAHRASQKPGNIRTIILGKNFKGTTYSATGLIAPRPDYLLLDHELVGRTSFECLVWRRLFYPEILTPQTFLIPLGPEMPHSKEAFEILLQYYDSVTLPRQLFGVGKHFRVSKSELREMEPGLKKSFTGAIGLKEWTVDPTRLMNKLLSEISQESRQVVKYEIEDLKDFRVKNNLIEEIVAIDSLGNLVRVTSDRGPLTVVNTAGPWMKDVCANLGVSIDYDLRVGMQMEIPGRYFNSGIITFDSKGKYLICLQKDNRLQMGPTNSKFSGHPDNFQPDEKEADNLRSTLATLLADKKLPSYHYLKVGFRVKPTWVDTNRPIIWNHGDAGLANFYSLHPGKMALALLAGEEMLERANNDDRLPVFPKIAAPNQFPKPVHLDGNRKIVNEIRLLFFKGVSLIKFGLFYLRHTLSS